MSTKRIGILTFIASTSIGCAGASVNIVAPDANYPISITRALPEKGGRVLRMGEGLTKVGAFELESTEYGFIYGATGSTLDLSESVNAQVASAGGEGITELQVEIEHCAVNYFFPLTLLPFWPGCEDVSVAGTIVKRGAQ